MIILPQLFFVKNEKKIVSESPTRPRDFFFRAGAASMHFATPNLTPYIAGTATVYVHTCTCMAGRALGTIFFFTGDADKQKKKKKKNGSSPPSGVLLQG